MAHTSITRRDFLKLKSLLLLWYYFLQSFGINLLSENPQKIDYTLLDKLQQLPFSKEVMEELNLRIRLQKEYCTDANGKLLPLDRFIKEMTNFIVSKKDFNDFKLLNSIKDEQMDYRYMFISTARHNEKKSMKYLQKRLISHKNDTLLNDALVYAVKSKSFDTTLLLMQQKLKLDNDTQKHLLDLLRTEEYDIFYKKISGNNHMMLPDYSTKALIKKRKMSKKTFSFEDSFTRDGSFVYDYLKTVVYNSLVDAYTQNLIDEFTLKMRSKKVHIITFSTNYPINFLEQFESFLYRNGFNSWREDLMHLSWKSMHNSDKSYLEYSFRKFLYEQKIDTYDFINIEMA